MQKNLVIVESPAKAKTIEKFLGSDYKVMSSFGHIRDLKKKNFGVDLETFQPEYEIPEDKLRVVAELRSLAKKADTVWLASDEDREGEAISWHLAEVLKLDPQSARRIVFHEITKPAILAAIEHPRTIDLNLVDAQQARRILDRLVGFKLSPVLWRKVRPSLSAGRVQSVAVRLIVEREREIENFVVESNYRIVANFSVPDEDGNIVSMRAALSIPFATADEAKAFLEDCKDATFTINSIQKKPVKRFPAPPFTTSTLQQEAARKLGYPVSLTMRIAQSLYESGLITYMRTDSMNLSALCLNTAGPVIEEMAGKEYHKRRNYHTSAKGAQEAHEAIRPTDMKRSAIKGSTQEQHLYDLIWKRTIACQMADAELEKTTAVISISGKEVEFVATGEVVTFDGFLRVYRESYDDVEESEDNRLLPPMTEGQVIEREDISAVQRFSQPPVRFTEASLVHKLEELGIGRPSTYAPTIQTIQQRKYVRRGESDGVKRNYEVYTLKGNKIKASTRHEVISNDRGRLVPTDTGTIVTDFLKANFPNIMDYNFTANVEQEFDDIAEGGKDWVELIRNFYTEFDHAIEAVMAERNEHKVGERLLGEEPGTGKPVCVKIGRFGPMVQIGNADDEGEKPRFAKLAKNQSMSTITLEEALDLFRLPRTLGEYEGDEVRVGVGKFGPYVAHQKKYTSLEKGDDPLCITLERAIELIQAKREQDQKSHLKSYDEEADLEVRSGRFGPYIAYKGTNYRIPKAQAERAAELTYEEVKKIIETEAARPKRKK
ncbi:MAG: type I DNA topoisomerase [Bacteroidales bacterium]|nr:type I DNA topoisomerase [Bacteroidales bacterium]